MVSRCDTQLLQPNKRVKQFEMSEAVNRCKYTTPEGSAAWEYITATCCALLIFSVGCMGGWNSPSLSILMGPDSPIPLTPTDASTLSSMVAVGHLVAPLLTIVLNGFGRKVGLYATGVPMIIGFGLIIVAKETLVLILARFVCGLSLGLCACFAPMYMGEITSARLRGSLGIVYGTMMNGGMLFMNILVPNLSVRMTAWVCLCIVTISTLSIWFIPESPYFLVMHDKIDEAEGVLEKLRGKTDVTEDLEIIKETVRRKDKVTESSKEEGEQETPKNISSFKRVFAVPGNRKALIINLLLLLVLQIGGYVTAMVYGHIMFDAMKSGLSSDICMMISAVMTLICNIATGFIIDKLGRRRLIFISGATSGTCLLIVGTYFYLLKYTEFDVTPYKLIAPCAMFGTIVASNIGLVPVQPVIQSETLDTDVKALVTCVLGISGGVLASVAVKSYLLLAVVWDFGHCVPFFISSAVTWIGVILILKLLPETKGRTLLEIQKDLNA